MEQIQVDGRKCVRCGSCADVCPTGLVVMGPEGPRAEPEGRCIACGHCVAVCPEAAMDNAKAPLAKQAPAGPALDPDTAARFLRARRSIRSYKSDVVQRNKILRLLDVARLAPSGSNSQGVSYLVIDKADTLRAITAATVEWMEGLIERGAPSSSYYSGTVERYRKTGRDVILRGAPCFIAAMAPESVFARGRDNTRFTLAYAELYAPTLGLGTCWTGYIESCAASGHRPLLDILKLPEGMALTGGLMVGYPSHGYERLVDRNPLKISWGE